jgi:EAL domain-containing protein (putative c-di-GMP-specific phosphodiesterase class I)/GGDEF domain-containing protein
MFRHLRTRLTVLYAGLFGASLLLLAAALYAVIAGNAERQVGDELTSSATVFNRIWVLRSQQMQEGAALLSRDFGFREAVASKDAATIRSALANLAGRLGADRAFIVGLDGSATAADGRPIAATAAKVLASLDQDEDASGVFVLDGAPFQAISAPILSPTLTGWVVFANKLDRGEMRSLERLSSIPLRASVVYQAQPSVWRFSGGDGAGVDPMRLSRFVDLELSGGQVRARRLATSGGSSIALVTPLKTLSTSAPAALVLRYPMALALAPYRVLLEAAGGVGLLGFLILLAGSWALARSVTRPITALAEAAHRLQRGESAEVEVTTQDEIGRLASSFNAMASEIRAREGKITHLAMHDAETDLPNRRSLEERIVPMAAAGDGRLVVAALGVDRFAHVRGAIGFSLAADLIGEIGARLSLLHPGYPLARLSTDVVGVGFLAKDAQAAQRLAIRLLAELEAPLSLGDNTIDVSLTIGLAVQGEHDDLVSSIVERATIALDQARGARMKTAVFDPELYGDPASNLSLMSEMLEGLDRGQMILHHQPKLDLRAGRATGVEVLIRWRHPARGLIVPDRFIPMAEETGHIGALTEWVLARALEEQALIRHQGHELTVSVNLSGRLLGDPGFAAVALEMVRGAPGKLCFEITETAVIDNPEIALRSIDRFKAAGIDISIDDYGSGLSSLAYLKQIQADELKVDKAFVLKIDESHRDALLVRSTVDLAHSLGLKVTAEGVETPTALSLLAGMGCDLAQGYLIARPMPLKELLMFLDEEGAGKRLRA